MLDVPAVIGQLNGRVHEAETKYKVIQEICRSCTGHSDFFEAETACNSLDCPVYYTRLKSLQKVRLSETLNKVTQELQNQEDLKMNELLMEMF